MATSEVEICNAALLLAGADRIDALSEENQRARLCNEIYTNEKNLLLYRHPWNFAILRVELGLLSTAPEYEYESKFQLPSDCLRVLDVDTDYPYEIEGTYLLSDDTEIFIKYISSAPTVATFSQGFCEALSYRIASKLAYAISQNASLADSLWKKAEDAENYARSFDAQEGRSGATVVADEWLNSRF